ncbi:MAG: acyl-CoA reductase [Bacteroidetes bacterium]|nr:acyl-CoA reductase [Bacteroidota bacterium]
MNLTERIELASRLGDYMGSDEPQWVEAQQRAYACNPWFIPEFVKCSVNHICQFYLHPEKLWAWTSSESIPPSLSAPQTVGLVMASNLPLVGFYDWLCCWVVGHQARIKLSGQDSCLFEHLVQQLVRWEARVAPYIQLVERLSGSDAYIATGGNNTSRYFDYYFGLYPHIIRKSRSSAALLTGHETPDELTRLSADMYTYFGRGCRSITHLLVPRGYDFTPLLQAGTSFSFLQEHHKFKNNYDYQLALCLLNKEYYMTNGICLLVERPSLHAPIGVVQYQYYDQVEEAEGWLSEQSEQIQCRVGGANGLSFGQTQLPTLTDYADGANTIQFLLGLEPTR